MKVKHFVAFDAQKPSLDEQINKFIADKKVIDIKFSSNFGGGDFNLSHDTYSALVMYEESKTW